MPFTSIITAFWLSFKILVLPLLVFCEQLFLEIILLLYDEKIICVHFRFVGSLSISIFYLFSTILRYLKSHSWEFLNFLLVLIYFMSSGF